MTMRTGFLAFGVAATLALALLGGVTAATYAADGAPEGAMKPQQSDAMAPPMHGPGAGGHQMMMPNMPMMQKMMPPPPPPPRMADLLARAEVEIGIRSQQLDAWRDFTDALVAICEPPKPPKPMSGASEAQPQPFAKALALADDMVQRGQKAEKLKAAVDVLKTKLSAEQLQKVAEIELRMKMPHPFPPPPPHHGTGDLAPGAMPSPPHP